MSQELETRRRRRRKPAERPKVRVFASREKGPDGWFEADDSGTFREMYARYGDAVMYWCGDFPPKRDRRAKAWVGYRLDNNTQAKTAELSGHKMGFSLIGYGGNKAWLDSRLKVMGKRVVLVEKAADPTDPGFLPGVLGTVVFLVVVGGVLKQITESQHERMHRNGVRHSHSGKVTRDTRGVPRRFRTRKDKRKFRVR